MPNEYFEKRFYSNILPTAKEIFRVDGMIKDHMANEYFKLRLAICVFSIPSRLDWRSVPTLLTSPTCRTVLAMQLVITNANRTMQSSDLVVATIFDC
jgi:hypothetical protein